ncbi:MAG TPA: A/G-specific adenine glycosylase [Micropepsaceae bacterium]|nr:A/G-specific adenine glycosylase [Micropepsaceae bacterium]
MSLMASVPEISRDKPIKASATRALLTWYDANRRDLPWRAKAGQVPDPYHVWLSEIMLQQTTVAAVGRYYRVFLKRWPDVESLARASLDEVLGAWAGLGYYSRARNLHRAARVVAGERGGAFPKTSQELKALPGVGGYTAGAIAAIAFGERVPAIDANAERVITRLGAVAEPLPKIKKRLAELADPLVPSDRPGDFAQALMDLGAMVCLPKQPLCLLCPLEPDCEGRKLGIAGSLPRKAEKPERPLKRGAAYVAMDSRAAVYLVKRPEDGLLGGMLQPPLGPWQAEFPTAAVAKRAAPFSGEWRKKLGIVRHGFTHFELELEVYVAHLDKRPKGEGRWLTPDELTGAALPTVMRKVIAHALGETRRRQLSSARTR